GDAFVVIGTHQHLRVSPTGEVLVRQELPLSIPADGAAAISAAIFGPHVAVAIRGDDHPGQEVSGRSIVGQIATFDQHRLQMVTSSGPSVTGGFFAASSDEALILYDAGIGSITVLACPR